MQAISTLRIITFVLFVIAIGASLFLLPLQHSLSQFLTWVQGVGPWGAVLLGAAYIPAALLFVPGSLLTLGAGFVLGVALGTVVVSIGSTLGATAAFLAGRTLARRCVEAKVSGNPKFQAIDHAVRQEGFKIVLLARLSPVFPFNLLNYTFGLTLVSLRDYVLASWIGMLPGTVMYVYLGSAVKNLADILAGRVEGGVVQHVLFGVGLVATLAVTAVVTRIGRKALSAAVASGEAEPRTRSEGKVYGA
jgi:uncharacterized membrane protein YdjX (TVP38/TMEM64 family)